jgi:N-acetylglucosamine-6-phosphate deacetylase
MGLDDRGSLAVGQRADVVALDEDLRVMRVLRGGEWT